MKEMFQTVVLFVWIFASPMRTDAKEEVGRAFDPERDLLSLHYDHAPDRDDGHSAAADRTVIESLFGAEWMVHRVLPISGTYGKNKRSFISESDAVMDVVWKARGGWVAVAREWDKAVETVYERWLAVLTEGGDVFVKEGGQSDFTAAVVKRLRQEHPEIETHRRIHVIQHSRWNEDQTTPEALEYVKMHARYVRISDANRYLNVKGGDVAFTQAAIEHPVFGPSWQAAFKYYDPVKRLDFSDTGELLYILGLGEMSVTDFMKRFLQQERSRPSLRKDNTGIFATPPAGRTPEK